ncbi:hypothetical protein C4J88_2905 [Pseudomonas sp. R4-39-08]|nr:hypothetical protein C4J88_2905 [Pseudomonas sp. R4-39-08]
MVLFLLKGFSQPEYDFAAEAAAVFSGPHLKRLSHFAQHSHSGSDFQGFHNASLFAFCESNAFCASVKQILLFVRL